MKKILLMSLSILILALNTLPSNSFASEYFSEETEREFKGYELSAMEKLFGDIDEVFYHDYIKDKNSILNRKYNDLTTENILPPPPPIFSNNENHYFQQNDHLNSEQAILMSPSSSVFMMPPPLPLKSIPILFRNVDLETKAELPERMFIREDVELTEIEKNEIIRIHTAGLEGLDFNNLKTRDIKTWKRIFDDKLSKDECLKRKLEQKINRLRKKEYNARPEVKERNKEYNARPEVKELNKEYRKNRKRKRNANKDIDGNKRPTKKRKVE